MTRKLQVDGHRSGPQQSRLHWAFHRDSHANGAFWQIIMNSMQMTDAGTKARQNSIGGTITDFMDGTGTNLGFKVTLERAVDNIM